MLQHTDLNPYSETKTNETAEAKISFKQQRKQDALDLAELIYDMFCEAERNNTNKSADKD